MRLYLFWKSENMIHCFLSSSRDFYNILWSGQWTSTHPILIMTNALYIVGPLKHLITKLSSVTYLWTFIAMCWNLFLRIKILINLLILAKHNSNCFYSDKQFKFLNNSNILCHKYNILSIQAFIILFLFKRSWKKITVNCYQ